MKIIFYQFVSSVYFNTCHFVLELSLNLKKCIRIYERSE